MPPTNDFIQFCPTSTGSNLLSQADYIADAQRLIGNQPGVARSTLANKAMRQSAVIASQFAQFLANQRGVDVLDDGTTAALIAQITSALAPKAPIITKLTAGSGTWNKSYVFAIASGSATVGATYTNNGITYTVSATVASALQVIMTGNGAPLVAGTLTKASGTGDATITFYAVASAIYLRARIVGPGGGGGGGGGNGGSGSANSTFGNLTAALAGGGATSGSGGTPGSATVGAGWVGVAVSGSGGNPAGGNVNPASGGNGGAGAFGGAGRAPFGGTNAAGTDGVFGSGGGGYSPTSGSGGGGGGAGGLCDAFTSGAVAATYAWVIGTGGVAGAGAPAGGVGGDGVGFIEEHFQ